MSRRVVTGGRPAPLFSPLPAPVPAPLGARPAMSTPALWTLLAPCANIWRMTAAATETLPADLPADDTADAAESGDADLVLADLLVEEISIDGMCGVY